MADYDPNICRYCGGPTREKIGRYGAFMACVRYPICKGYGGKRKPRGASVPRAESSATAAHALPAPDLTGQDMTDFPSVTSAPSGDAGAALWALIRDNAQAEIGGIIHASIQKTLAAMPERVARIEFVRDGVKMGEVDGHRHEAFARIAEKARMGFKNLMLVGPAGTGKSTLARQLAEALGVGYGEMDCTDGTTETHLLGRCVPNITTGTNEYQESQFVKLAKSGGVFCFNESDWLNASVWGCIHEALANGHIFIPATGETIVRHPDFYVICTANTYGQGATRQYLRNQLDAATLDRFVGAVVTVDYDETLEKALVDPDVFYAVKQVRDKLTENASRRVWGMRVMLATARMHANGVSIPDAIKECMVGWSDQDRRNGDIS